MRLAFINHTHPDTPHVSAMRMHYFARVMAARGHQVVLVTGESPAHPGQGLRAGQVDEAVAGHDWAQPLVLPVLEQSGAASPGHADATGLPSLARRLRTAWRLLGGDGIHGPWVANARPLLERLAQAHAPDLVWTTFGNTSNLQLGQWLAHKSGCPWVADIKDNWCQFIPRGLRRAVAWRFRDAAGLTTNAWIHLRAATTWGGSRPASVVYSGVAETFFQARAGAQQGQHQDVLMVGSTYSESRLRELLAVLKQWMDALPAPDRARLRFVYAGSDVQRVEDALQVVSLPCTCQVLRQMPVEELARRASSSLFNCYVASDTGFHHKLLELLVAGRPLVCYPDEHPESRQLATEVDTGFHVCVDADALVTAFSTIHDTATAEATASPPPAWRWDDFAVGLEQFFEELTQERGAPCAA